MKQTSHSDAPTILIIDNQAENIKLLSEILGSAGYRITTTNRGNMALPAVQDASPDLILLDPNLPDLTGYAVCRLLKAVPDTENIPVIFIDCPDNPLDKEKVFDVGGADYLIRPFKPAEVLSRIKPHAALRHLNEQIKRQSTTFKKITTRLQNEMAVARDIQRGLLPPPSPNWPALQVNCFTQSARQVGGDFYTYHTFDTRLKGNEKRYSLAVGDVSGKGMPAALLMAISLASFKNLITQEYSLNKLVTDMVTETYSLGRFLTDLDKAIAFYTSTTRQNCAMVYVEITKPTKPNTPVTLQAVNAGCITPIICRADGTVSWMDVGGMPLGSGLGGQLGYQEETVSLSPGDLVILTSDGAVEANNDAHEMLGFDRLEEIVKTGPRSGAAIMMEHIQGEVMDFVGNTPLHDDITIVVVQV